MSFFSDIPQIPQHCHPTNDFLQQVSSTLGTCIPTPFAAISTLLGALSILSWLFAQLPQIIKNYKLKSTSGLSIYFLSEWCLGDISNVLGAILTRQAAWQITVGAYYCFVDTSLVIQWFWYCKLRHGRRMRGILRATFQRYRADENGDMRRISEFAPSMNQQQRPSEDGTGKRLSALPTPIPTPSEEGFFRIPKYAASLVTPEEERKPGAFSKRQILRLQDNPLPSPSPRTILFLTFMIALASTTGTANANPLTRLDQKLDDLDLSSPAISVIGPLLSWLSMVLYVTSRVPQLLANARLRSTAGLSPQLFLAAFCGNFFYSTSLLFNPQAWHSYPAFGAHGWVGEDGSNRGEWISRTAPFFLGASLVLALDILVGIQFWMYAERAEEIVLVVEEEGQGAGKWKWQEVHGWMRGWRPNVSRVGTPVGSREGSAVDESRSLLGGVVGEARTSDGGTYGGV